MVPQAGDGGSPAPIDRPILEFLQTRVRATNQVGQASVTDASGHLELRVRFAPSYYPATVDQATLTVHWYTNDDCKIHHREVHSANTWECRWDCHPNPHNTRDHFHPSPTASSPGDDAAWPTDYRDVLSFVLDEVEQRITQLWGEEAHQ